MTMRVPATTSVAAWMTAETEVGPSMASGNQLWTPMVTDLILTMERTSVSSMLPAYVDGLEHVVREDYRAQLPQYS